jgi:HEAT repeat protein
MDERVRADARRWKVQQQAALTLSRIYSESSHCGRSYCDGDPPERIRNVKAGWVRLIALDAERRALSTQERLDRFTREPVFWKQFEIARVLADLGDRTAVAALEAGLTHDDRHLRGNVAFVLARLGDWRGFETLAGILADRSSRAEGQGIPGGRWSLQGQIRADRYYAALLLGHLKDPRAVDLLTALLDDQEVRATVPWSLAQIGDRRAIGPLITLLSQDDPATRGLAIHALETLNAREALPSLHQLRDDTRISGLEGRTTVADAARHAITVLSQRP